MCGRVVKKANPAADNAHKPSPCEPFDIHLYLESGPSSQAINVRDNRSNTAEGVGEGAVGVEAIQPANGESQVECVDFV